MPCRPRGLTEATQWVYTGCGIGKGPLPEKAPHAMSRTPLLDRAMSLEARSDLEALILEFAEVIESTHEEWRSQAACAQQTTFFPERGKSNDARAAKAICARCPVQKPCLAYALDRRLEEGIWGGTTPEQRRVILRQRRN